VISANDASDWLVLRCHGDSSSGHVVSQERYHCIASWDTSVPEKQDWVLGELGTKSSKNLN